MRDTYFKVLYTSRAHQNAAAIKQYILYYFTQREVNNFLKLLNGFEQVVCVFPQLYRKVNKSKNVHRAVLSKQLSVFYIIKRGEINVVAIMDNRMSDTKWP